VRFTTSGCSFISGGGGADALIGAAGVGGTGCWENSSAGTRRIAPAIRL
jgi:hypothetical protein